MQKEVVIRLCDKCERLLPIDRKGTQSGILYGGGEYYCNTRCMGKDLEVSPTEAQQIIDDAVARDSDDIYYTEWELEEIE